VGYLLGVALEVEDCFEVLGELLVRDTAVLGLQPPEGVLAAEQPVLAEGGPEFVALED
jgi:hypothetical protein